ncbi:GNAT family N-acetyltransferase [Lapidilactobacillus bayanensis]|uniref:GNAT family N-acetyltransferase n=1 Tax=Lapidilactobacillus bayanensis TaxID=2485998 RepID=UPI000F779C9F|nr:GNAT family N-acetyltransferase [Lapidilactobacillus bayanensis]
MTIELRKMNQKDARAEFDFFQTMPVENGFEVPYKTLTYQEFVTTAIPERLLSSRGLGPAVGRVPDTYFFLWDDSQLIGLFKIRHYLNEQLRHGAGHIGYGILPQFRGRGYGTRGLSLALEACDHIMPADEPEIYLSCARTNTASLQVMLNNGGRIVAQDEKENYVHILRERH